MKRYDDDSSYPQEPLDNGSDPYPDSYDEAYDDYDDDYEKTDLDEELDSEHHFRIAMNVFDLVSMLVGVAAFFLLAGLLFSLINWVQRNITESLSVFITPFF